MLFVGIRKSLSNTLTNLTEFDVVVVFYFVLFISILNEVLIKRKEKEKIYFLDENRELFIYL